MKRVTIARLLEDIRSVGSDEHSFVEHNYSVGWDAIARPGSDSAWSSIHGARGRFACVFHHGGHSQGEVQTLCGLTRLYTSSRHRVFSSTERQAN